MNEPHSQSRSFFDRNSSRDRSATAEAISSYPLSTAEIEKLLRLSHENVRAQTNLGSNEELGPGDVQYLRGDSVHVADFGDMSQAMGIGPMAIPSSDASLDRIEQHLAEAILNADQNQNGMTSTKADLPIEVPRTAVESAQGVTLEDLSSIELDISIELGRAELLIDDILKLRSGSVVSLDKLAGDPVDIMANGKLVARGELLVVDGKFGVRLSEVL